MHLVHNFFCTQPQDFSILLQNNFLYGLHRKDTHALRPLQRCNCANKTDTKERGERKTCKNLPMHLRHRQKHWKVLFIRNRRLLLIALNFWYRFRTSRCSDALMFSLCSNSSEWHCSPFKLDDIQNYLLRLCQFGLVRLQLQRFSKSLLKFCRKVSLYKCDTHTRAHFDLLSV